MIGQKSRYAYLEGIRGVAALVVVLAHLKNTFAWNANEFVDAFLKVHIHSPPVIKFVYTCYFVCFDGTLAVYVFWLMSGYVISVRFFRENEKSYLRQSVTKRYFRLMVPAAASVFVGFLLMKLNAMHNLELVAHLGGDPDGWLASQFNFEPGFLEAVRSAFWDTFFDYRWDTTYNSSLWTMQPELFGSLFCFSVFGIVGLHKRRFLVYGVLLGISILSVLDWLSTFLIGFILSDIDHTDNPFKGASLWVEQILSQKRILVILCIPALLFMKSLENYIPVDEKNLKGLYTVITASLFVVTVMKCRPLAILFESKPILWLGKISFSLYLLHLSVVCSLGCYLYLVLDGTHVTKVTISSAAVILVSLFAASLYDRYVNTPAIRLSNRIGKLFAGDGKKED